MKIFHVRKFGIPGRVEQLSNEQKKSKKLLLPDGNPSFPLCLRILLKTYPWFRIVDYSHFHNVIFGSFWYPRDQWEAKAYIPDTDCININSFLPNVILYSAKYWNEHVDFMWIFNFKAVNVSYLTFQIVNDGPKRTDSCIFTITNWSPIVKPEKLVRSEFSMNLSQFSINSQRTGSFTYGF